MCSMREMWKRRHKYEQGKWHHGVKKRKIKTKLNRWQKQTCPEESHYYPSISIDIHHHHHHRQEAQTMKRKYTSRRLRCSFGIWSLPRFIDWSFPNRRKKNTDVKTSSSDREIVGRKDSMISRRGEQPFNWPHHQPEPDCPGTDVS